MALPTSVSTAGSTEVSLNNLSPDHSPLSADSSWENTGLKSPSEPEPRIITMPQGVLIADYNGQQQHVRLQLTEDTLFIQKQEQVYTHSPTDHVDSALLARERTVHVKREKIGGLGLSVKGGAEHNLPILISRIFKDQAADKTGQLFVGDAVLKVNEASIESFCHDEAVTALKNAGEDVTLIVKYFHPASLFLSKNKQNANISEKDQEAIKNMDTIEMNGNDESEKQWSDFITIPLLCAYITCYLKDTDQIRSDGFEVVSMDGLSSGVILCDDETELADWVSAITSNIHVQNNRSIALTNKILLPRERVMHMCWLCERVKSNKIASWKRLFFTLKGQDVCFFESPPVKTKDWVRCEYQYKVHECMLRVLKDSELEDGRHHCLVVESGEGTSHYLSVESRQEVLQIERSWYQATTEAVRQLRTTTFGCKWKGQLCGLTLDLSSGYTLYENETKRHCWTHRFSQMKASSDDGKTKLQLVFAKDYGKSDIKYEIESSSLRTLLYTMHAFLSAKLASVDPSFLNAL